MKLKKRNRKNKKFIEYNENTKNQKRITNLNIIQTWKYS